MGKPLDEQAALWSKGNSTLPGAKSARSPCLSTSNQLRRCQSRSSVFPWGSPTNSLNWQTLLSRGTSSGVWSLLVISIVLVLLASVGLHRYLLKAPAAGDTADEQRYKQRYNVAATQVGLSAIALAAAASIFAAFGALVILGHDNKVNAEMAIARALAVTLPQLGKHFPSTHSSMLNLRCLRRRGRQRANPRPISSDHRKASGDATRAYSGHDLSCLETSRQLPSRAFCEICRPITRRSARDPDAHIDP